MRAIARLVGTAIVLVALLAPVPLSAGRACCDYGQEYAEGVCAFWCSSYGQQMQATFCGQGFTCICDGGQEWLSVDCEAGR